ncbi:MAG: Hsp20/alpha crystallin family protein [Cyanobacteria bacterium P01_C01_bin.120]
MALLRQSPFAEFGTLQHEMNRLFDSLSPFEGDRFELDAFLPSAEMTETSDAIALSVELPGLNAEDVDIQVTQDSVSISGERRSESNVSENGLTRSEFKYGSFRRVIPLSTRIDNTQATANYENGILKLHLPKVAEERNEVVKVNLN